MALLYRSPIAGAGRARSSALRNVARSSSSSQVFGSEFFDQPIVSSLTGAIDLEALTSSGDVLVIDTITGAITLGALASAGQLSVLARLTGAIGLDALTVSGTIDAVLPVYLTGAMTLGPMETSGLVKTSTRNIQPLRRRPTAWFDRRRGRA